MKVSIRTYAKVAMGHIQVTLGQIATYIWPNVTCVNRTNVRMQLGTCPNVTYICPNATYAVGHLS